MSRFYKGREIRFFTINNRSSDPSEYWDSFRKLVALSDANDFDGLLCFSANETLIDPWMAGQYLMENSQRMVPIIAVNPIYMHPFAAAKMVSSLAYMYGRKTVLNLITGTSARDREVLDDEISHEERYERLGEYALLIKGLLSSKSVTRFDGQYYRIADAVLSPTPPADIFPDFLVAGHSASARRIAERVKATHLSMLSPDFSVKGTADGRRVGVHLGVIAAETDDAAWALAEERFPDDPSMEGILDFMMETNDSAWKQALYKQLISAENRAPEFWLEPFRQMRGDCPYIVGSFKRVAQILAQHIEAGVDWFIFDMPPIAEDFTNANLYIGEAFQQLAGRRLLHETKEVFIPRN
ncbi:LLM class flavin-dependent oxidoreductase [Brucella pseudogrignonensis]|uniref:LLM class flavin-dependent oxidoreductase n=1 Tax=Brucella pseudogrignonensis TaxID=419475 RepID=UPI0038B431CA